MRNSSVPFSKPALLAGFLFLLISTSCSANGVQAVPTTLETVEQVKNPTVTAFQPSPPTPEPEKIRLWLSPILPEYLNQLIREDLNHSELEILLVEDLETADVRIGVNGERRLTEWIYAVGAPFPTILDALTWEDLALLWHKSGESDANLIVTQPTYDLLSTLLGASFNEGVEILPAKDLLEYAWGEGEFYSVIPFEELSTGWKVLELEGQSPIRKEFEPAFYPLTVEFGLSGDSQLVDRIAGQLSVPATNRDPAKLTTLVMTGVTALTRATAWRMEVNGIEYPGALIANWLEGADITHVSNEVSFWEDCPPPDPIQTSLKFCSDPKYIDLLVGLGVDVVELTGNHNMDFGPEPYLYSLDLYRENDLQVFAGGADIDEAVIPRLIEHNGNRFAFFGCNSPGPKYAQATEDRPGAVPCDSHRLWRMVGQFRKAGYLPIVTFQWAEGSSILPLQREAFRGAVDSGAVLVSGSQAHGPLGFEFYNDAFIHYGLGNLFFDQMQSLQNREEFIDRHVFYDGRHISTELLTAMLEDYAQPRPMTPDEREALLRRTFRSSEW